MPRRVPAAEGERGEGGHGAGQRRGALLPHPDSGQHPGSRLQTAHSPATPGPSVPTQVISFTLSLPWGTFCIVSFIF